MGNDSGKTMREHAQDPCPDCGGDLTVVDGRFVSCVDCEWYERKHGIGA